ncbi:uncharacterized protein LY89DRAFT_785697 [Mollisia scopiformis]|uniref:Uncharacterized protein n=1 Tax=Mollisia scopiformis TaxID=149040 RepID=A0A194WXA0_MOLSC|nr:uncharacterized protein LY89DRAFT_785697 [Mollisia scopiformis]KUJ12309.1 hypothetical protein LY89DRAFT_785697 [Mollisia scopiformis]
MSLYRGWDRELLRRAGTEMNQVESSSDQFVQRSMSSFTPINPIAPPVQFISSQKTLHERDIYEIVEVPAERPDVVVPKKRGRAQNKGRAVSVDPLWEYVDEGDLAGQNKGGDFETTFPKRRKSASAKRASSSKAMPYTLSQFSKVDTQADSLDYKDQAGAQLTTLDSGNNKKKKAGSAKAQTTKSKMGPFKPPTITKPGASRKKDAVEDPVQTMPNSYLGHVTTQESVKLAQTTLDKLAAFRYMPPSTAEQTKEASSVQHNVQSRAEPNISIRAAEEELFDHATEGGFMLGDDDLSHERNLNEPGAYEGYAIIANRDLSKVPIEDHPVSGEDAFFNDVTWNVQVSDEPQYNILPTEEQHQSSASAPELIGDPHIAKSHLRLESQSQWLKTTHSSRHEERNDSGSIGRLCGVAVHGDPSYGSSQFEPNSSETRALLRVLDNSQPAHQFQDNLSEQFSGRVNEPPVPRNLPNTDDDMLHVASDTQAPAGEHEPSSQALPALDPGHNRRTDPSKDVQVERSDLDDANMVMIDVSKDYDLEDFDEGLNDSDLMDLVSQPVVPATQSIMASEPLSSGHGVLPQKQLESQTKGSGQRVLVPSPHGIQHTSTSSRPSSPFILGSDIDDDFPLDEDMEEEMMNLADPAGVLERFQPPPSLHYSSGEGSASGEVYDSSLQFSPQKHYFPAESAGQQKFPDNTANSLADSEDLLDDDEDWSFIRTNNESTAEKYTPDRRHSKRPIVSPAEEAEVVEISPVRSQAVSGVRPSFRRQPSISQLTTDTTSIILDDSHEYEPLKPFARPDFPGLIRDRSPIVGLSSQSFLRVCFRVAEMFKEGAKCHALKENAVIELYARVILSSREPGTTKQHFQFADLWHDRPPLPSGILANYKSPELLQRESGKFIGASEGMMARCFGRLKRDSQSTTGWVLDIISIRTTDWEEIRWTKRIVSAGLMKSESKGLSKL